MSKLQYNRYKRSLSRTVKEWGDNKELLFRFLEKERAMYEQEAAEINGIRLSTLPQQKVKYITRKINEIRKK